jgi:hypothetical protein
VSTIENYEQRLNDHANSAQMAEQEAARAIQLEFAVKKLEEEKAGISQDLEKFHLAFYHAVNQFKAAKQKIGELKQEKRAWCRTIRMQQQLLLVASVNLSSKRRAWCRTIKMQEQLLLAASVNLSSKRRAWCMTTKMQEQLLLAASVSLRKSPSRLTITKVRLLEKD